MEYLTTNKFKTISRDPNSLKNLFKEYKNILFSIITPDIYVSYGFSEHVNDLLLSYSAIKNTPNHEQVFSTLQNDKQCFEDGFEGNSVIIDRCMNRMNNVFMDKLEKLDIDKLKNSDDQYYHMKKIDRLTSFWYRRYTENNSQATFEILLEIQQHYTKQDD